MLAALLWPVASRLGCIILAATLGSKFGKTIFFLNPTTTSAIFIVDVLFRVGLLQILLEKCATVLASFWTTFAFAGDVPWPTFPEELSSLHNELSLHNGLAQLFAELGLAQLFATAQQQVRTNILLPVEAAMQTVIEPFDNAVKPLFHGSKPSDLPLPAHVSALVAEILACSCILLTWFSVGGSGKVNRLRTLGFFARNFLSKESNMFSLTKHPCWNVLYYVHITLPWKIFILPFRPRAKTISPPHETLHRRLLPTVVPPEYHRLVEHPFVGRAGPHFLRSGTPKLSLDGEFAFRLFPNYKSALGELAELNNLADSTTVSHLLGDTSKKFDAILVPSHWELLGYERPIYVNEIYPPEFTTFPHAQDVPVDTSYVPEILSPPHFTPPLITRGGKIYIPNENPSVVRASSEGSCGGRGMGSADRDGVKFTSAAMFWVLEDGIMCVMWGGVKWGGIKFPARTSCGVYVKEFATEELQEIRSSSGTSGSEKGTTPETVRTGTGGGPLRPLRDDCRARLVFEGVSSCVYVYVNGFFVGYAEDSMGGCEFDVTDFLDYNGTSGKKNLLVCVVPKYSTGSYLECQDMWVLSGIFRSVYVELLPALGYVRDFRAVCDYLTKSVALEVDVATRLKAVDVAAGGENLTIAVELRDPGVKNKAGGPPAALPLWRWQIGNREMEQLAPSREMDSMEKTKFPPVQLGVVPDGEHCDFQDFPDNFFRIHFPALQLPWPTVEPWSPEDPRLYELVISLSTKNEILQQEFHQVGFRTVEVGTRPELPPNVLAINGRRVVLKGANRHEFHCARGRVLTEKDMIQDILLLKKAHFNAVRCSHYGNDRRWYALCDRFGLWVVDECNLENHHFVASTCMDLLHCEPRWEKAVADRAVNCFHRTKNHCCVVGYSLGKTKTR